MGEQKGALRKVAEQVCRKSGLGVTLALRVPQEARKVQKQQSAVRNGAKMHGAVRHIGAEHHGAEDIAALDSRHADRGCVFVVEGDLQGAGEHQTGTLSRVSDLDDGVVLWEKVFFCREMPSSSVS